MGVRQPPKGGCEVVVEEEPNPSGVCWQHFLLAGGGSPRVEAALRVSVRSSARSGLLLLGEVEDLAVSLSQVLLLFEVHLECTLDGDEGDAPLGKTAHSHRQPGAPCQRSKLESESGLSL